MNISIQPILVLLILSLITEKIANFIKLQKESWSNKKDSEQDEKIREKQIQTITLIVGIAIALIAKANLFLLFNDNFNLFWSNISEGESIASDIVGSILSGLFLSLGSKFFHDLLDLLLQVKNLKRKLNDKADWEFDNIAELDKYIKENDLENLKQLLDDTFKSIEGYYFYEIDYDNQRIKVHVKKGTEGIKDTILFKSATNKIKIFKVFIIEGVDK